MSSKGKTLTPAEAFELMSEDYRIHLRQKDSPIVVEHKNYEDSLIHYDSTEMDQTSQMKRVAAKRGFGNIQRLSKLDSDHLEDEIKALTDLREREYSVINKHFGAKTADKFESLGLYMAKTASPKRYRTNIVSSYESVEGEKIEASGYDEFAQTSIVASRAGGRLAALESLRKNKSFDSGKLDQLWKIHDLMSVTSSFVRGDTAGIASEHDDDAMKTRTQHPAKKDKRVKGGGSNSSYAHRMRTGIMQHAEESFVDSETSGGGDHPLMADIQRARLDAATLATTHMFNAPSTKNTLSSMSVENSSKIRAISGTRQIAKDMRDALAHKGNESFFKPPPSPLRTKDF